VASEDAKAEFSVDGKTWHPVSPDGLGKAVAGAYPYEIRVTFEKPVTQFEVRSTVQHNQEALPYLAPGRNTITVASENPEGLGENRLP